MNIINNFNNCSCSSFSNFSGESAASSNSSSGDVISCSDDDFVLNTVSGRELFQQALQADNDDTSNPNEVLRVAELYKQAAIASNDPQKLGWYQRAVVLMNLANERFQEYSYLYNEVKNSFLKFVGCEHTHVESRSFQNWINHTMPNRRGLGISNSDEYKWALIELGHIFCEGNGPIVSNYELGRKFYQDAYRLGDVEGALYQLESYIEEQKFDEGNRFLEQLNESLPLEDLNLAQRTKYNNLCGMLSPGRKAKRSSSRSLSETRTTSSSSSSSSSSFSSSGLGTLDLPSPPTPSKRLKKLGTVRKEFEKLKDPNSTRSKPYFVVIRRLENLSKRRLSDDLSNEIKNELANAYAYQAMQTYDFAVSERKPGTHEYFDSVKMCALAALESNPRNASAASIMLNLHQKGYAGCSSSDVQAIQHYTNLSQNGGGTSSSSLSEISTTSSSSSSSSSSSTQGVEITLNVSHERNNGPKTNVEDDLRIARAHYQGPEDRRNLEQALTYFKRVDETGLYEVRHQMADILLRLGRNTTNPELRAQRYHEAHTLLLTMLQFSHRRGIFQHNFRRQLDVRQTPIGLDDSRKQEFGLAYRLLARIYEFGWGQTQDFKVVGKLYDLCWALGEADASKIMSEKTPIVREELEKLKVANRAYLNNDTPEYSSNLVINQLEPLSKISVTDDLSNEIKNELANAYSYQGQRCYDYGVRMDKPGTSSSFAAAKKCALRALQLNQRNASAASVMLNLHQKQYAGCNSGDTQAIQHYTNLSQNGER